jgi:colanic acid/amylovoran biosynthesis protein
MKTGRPVITVMGGSPNTGNLGCSALGISAVKNLRMICPEARIVLQNWSFARELPVMLKEGTVNVEAMIVHRSNSLKARYGSRVVESAYKIGRRCPVLLGGVARLLSRTVSQFLDTDYVLDISGGDSFSDMYNKTAANGTLVLKLLIKRLRIPLLLLPQTYGPFHEPDSIMLARAIVEYSDLVATRDTDGIRDLENDLQCTLNGKAAECPDIAFTMDPVPVPLETEPALIRKDSGCIVGLNLNGLLYSEPKAFGLKEDYRQMMRVLVERLLSRKDTCVVFTPHVLLQGYCENAALATGECPHNCDRSANDLMYSELKEKYPGRIHCIRGEYSAPQMKYLIGQSDFFIGSRMHACIGALSQCVPTTVLAYSKKAAGVMSLAGIRDTVVDLREVGADECAGRILTMLDDRERLRSKLQERMPQVKQQVLGFFRDTLAPRLGIEVADV